MRPDEIYAGDRLVDFFNPTTSVTVSEGEDPPDLYLCFSDTRIGVEVTRLSQFTFESNGGLGNRMTQDSYGVRLINELNSELGQILPERLSLFVGLELPVENAAIFKRELKNWISDLISHPVLDARKEREIQGVIVQTHVIPRRSSGKMIVGWVSNNNSSADIGLNAQVILADRIRQKTKICTNLNKPIWLALLNDYFIADIDSYDEAYKHLNLDHCFERIFVIPYRGPVCVLEIGVRS
jgi:hypothetical protein